MSRMHNPAHPGAILADTVLRKNGGISLTEFSKKLRVSRVALSRVVNGRGRECRARDPPGRRFGHERGGLAEHAAGV